MTYTAPSTVVAGQTYVATAHNTIVGDIIDHESRLSSIEGAWTAWTPTYSGITVGNGTSTGRYAVIGRTVIARFTLSFGTTTAITAPAYLVVPPIKGNMNTSNGTTFGSGVYYDASTANSYVVLYTYNGSNTLTIRCLATTGLYQTISPGSQLNATVPVAFASGDGLTGQFIYESLT